MTTITTTLYGINYTWEISPDPSVSLHRLQTPNIDLMIYQGSFSRLWKFELYVIHPEVRLIHNGRSSEFATVVDQALKFVFNMTEEEILWRLERP